MKSHLTRKIRHFEKKLKYFFLDPSFIAGTYFLSKCPSQKSSRKIFRIYLLELGERCPYPLNTLSAMSIRFLECVYPIVQLLQFLFQTVVIVYIPNRFYSPYSKSSLQFLFQTVFVVLIPNRLYSVYSNKITLKKYSFYSNACSLYSNTLKMYNSYSSASRFYSKPSLQFFFQTVFIVLSTESQLQQVPSTTEDWKKCHLILYISLV